jgi:DNA-binding response OmpR family regulator
MSYSETGLFDPPRRVLVVDHDEAMRCEVCEFLRRAGYVVSEAAGALSAMRAVLADPLDVVVLDLVLPDGPGIDVARAFRAVTTTREICVVAMASHPASIAFVDPRTFGAASILVKPCSEDDLLAAVDGCFGEKTWTDEYEMPTSDRPYS